jgi:hypothetical protein
MARLLQGRRCLPPFTTVEAAPAVGASLWLFSEATRAEAVVTLCSVRVLILEQPHMVLEVNSMLACRSEAVPLQQ